MSQKGDPTQPLALGANAMPLHHPGFYMIIHDVWQIMLHSHQSEKKLYLCSQGSIYQRTDDQGQKVNTKSNTGLSPI